MVTTGLILENHSKVKSIVSISEGDSHPQIPTPRILQSHCIASAAVHSLHDGLLVVGWYFGLSEDLSVFVDERDLDNSIFFCDFDSSFPYHFFPVIEIVTLGSGERWDLEDGDSFCFVAEYKLRRLHRFKKQNITGLTSWNQTYGFLRLSMNLL